eukprot:TRINITY_DN12845_c0_g1_i1.p1 TRINITY_DN12845_c0_g1~~TRINITY_DN12845_c0_g1_i1.p1  ORF type:complete len:507 (-),score=117.08 TRINITY_DN12845_c0_g1_i1:381-1871(-)
MSDPPQAGVGAPEPGSQPEPASPAAAPPTSTTVDTSTAVALQNQAPEAPEPDSEPASPAAPKETDTTQPQATPTTSTLDQPEPTPTPTAAIPTNAPQPKPDAPTPNTTEAAQQPHQNEKDAPTTGEQTNEPAADPTPMAEDNQPQQEKQPEPAQQQDEEHKPQAAPGEDNPATGKQSPQPQPTEKKEDGNKADSESTAHVTVTLQIKSQENSPQHHQGSQDSGSASPVTPAAAGGTTQANGTALVKPTPTKKGAPTPKKDTPIKDQQDAKRPVRRAATKQNKLVVPTHMQPPTVPAPPPATPVDRFWEYIHEARQLRQATPAMSWKDVHKKLGPKFFPRRDDDVSRKRVAEKAAKDPNAPKKPKNRFFCFIRQITPKLKEENPKLLSKQVAKKGGEMWAKMTEQEKAKYDSDALLETKRYQEEMQAYNERASPTEKDGKESPKAAPAAENAPKAEASPEEEMEEDAPAPVSETDAQKMDAVADLLALAQQPPREGQ